jgi:hypothetical protein
MYMMCRYVMECTGLVSFWLWSFDFWQLFLLNFFLFSFIVSVGLHTFTLNSNYIWVHHMIVQVRFILDYGTIFFTELSLLRKFSVSLSDFCLKCMYRFICMCSYVIGMCKARSNHCFLTELSLLNLEKIGFFSFMWMYVCGIKLHV